MKNNKDEKALRLVSSFNQISSERMPWESHWQEISERCLPAQSKLFTNKSGQQGEKRTEFIFDSTAQVALKRFASILDSLLTPRNQTWHKLVPSDSYLAKDRNVKLWFEEVNTLLFKYRYAPNANFASNNQQNYISLGAFGTGCMYVDGLEGGEGLRYRAIHLGEIYFMENHQGIVDKAYRKFPMTARQAFQKFGDSLPEKIVTSAKDKPDDIFEFIHCVEPREDLDPTKADYRGMKFASYYVALNEKKIISEGGFKVFPYAISRYEQVPGETYGRSPAMDVLPAIKTLNEQKKTILKQGHRIVDPVLLAHDDGILDSFSLKPGAINAGGISAEGRALVQALPVGNLHIGKEMMEDERKIINDAFLVNIFQILVDSPQMTATEVIERTREKGILLAPTIGRQQSEYLGPMIEREFDILASQGLLPPMPQMLVEAKGEYHMEYDSPLSRAQRAEEASGFMRTMETALNIVNTTQDPSPLDHFNWDVIMPAVADIQGVPQHWLRGMKDIEAMRQGRAQEAQDQKLIQAAPAAAGVMKALPAMNKGG